MTLDIKRRYTAADLEQLTSGAVDRKTSENWHNRGLWLTPSESPPRGKPRLYSVAHLFEALTRAALIEGGFTHATARTAIELRLAEAALAKERLRGRRGSAGSSNFVFAKEVAQEIYRLPELKQPDAEWYWAIYFGFYDKKASEIARTVAFQGTVPLGDLLTTHRVASIVHISAIVRSVFAYAEQKVVHA